MITNPSLSDIESILNLSYKSINLHLNNHLTFEQNETFILLKIINNVILSDKKILDQLFIHIGCVIENIKIASNYLGYEIQLTHLVDLSQSHLSFDINSDLSILKIKFLKLKRWSSEDLKYHYLYHAEEVKPLTTNKKISSKFQFELQAMESEFFKITFKNNEVKK